MRVWLGYIVGNLYSPFRMLVDFFVFLPYCILPCHNIRRGVVFFSCALFFRMRSRFFCCCELHVEVVVLFCILACFRCSCVMVFRSMGRSGAL